jgi:hypothetical protein
MAMDFFPIEIIPFLEVFRNSFNASGFKYFLGFLWLSVGLTDRKCLTRMASSCPLLRRHVSGWSRFFSESPWSLKLLRTKIYHLLLNHLAGALFFKGYLVAALDTTLMVSFGRKMLGVQRWHDHSGNADRGGYIIGHHWGLIGLLLRRANRWVCLPLIARLFTGQKSPSWISEGGQIRTANFWDHALGLCRELSQTVYWPLIVVADAYFSKEAFINGINSMCTILISRLRDDAVGWIPCVPGPTARKGRRGRNKEREKIQLATLLKTLPLQTASICIYGAMRLVQYVSMEVYVRHVSFPIKVVVVKTGGKPLILLSTSIQLRAEDIIELYGARFAIEGCIRDLKSEMGWEDYQQTTTSGFYRFVNLTCLTYSLWRLFAFVVPPASWSSQFKKKPYVIREPESIGMIRESLRQRAIRVIINAHSAPSANLKKKDKLCDDLLRLAA